MGLPRSTFYDVPATPLNDTEIVGRMQTICDEFEAYGYRRVGAELRHQGVIVNHKKLRRLMREYVIIGEVHALFVQIVGWANGPSRSLRSCG